MSTIQAATKFEILNREETTAAEMDMEEFALVRLAGLYDNGDAEDLGLGAWQYSFEVDVTNQRGEQKSFTVIFQPKERSNRMEAYCGYEVACATRYGCDADESSDLEKFCDYDTQVIDALEKIAKTAAKSQFESLMTDFKNGELKLTNQN